MGGPRPLERNPREPRRNKGIHQNSYGNFKRLRNSVKSTDQHRNDPFGQVINLSDRSFTKAQFKLLGYNLNFIPTPNNINKKTLATDIKKFGRRVKLRDHFGITDTNKPAFKSESS